MIRFTLIVTSGVSIENLMLTMKVQVHRGAKDHHNINVVWGAGRRMFIVRRMKHLRLLTHKKYGTPSNGNEKSYQELILQK